jgi:hypothetical protein
MWASDAVQEIHVDLLTVQPPKTVASLRSGS